MEFLKYHCEIKIKGIIRCNFKDGSLSRSSLHPYIVYKLEDMIRISFPFLLWIGILTEYLI